MILLSVFSQLHFHGSFHGHKTMWFFCFRKILWTNRKRWERVAWWRESERKAEKRHTSTGALFRSLISLMLGVSQSTGVLGFKWPWLVDPAKAGVFNSTITHQWVHTIVWTIALPQLVNSALLWMLWQHNIKSLTSPSHVQCYWKRRKSEGEKPCNPWHLTVALVDWHASTAWREL